MCVCVCVCVFGGGGGCLGGCGYQITAIEFDDYFGERFLDKLRELAKEARQAPLPPPSLRPPAARPPRYLGMDLGTGS